MKDIKSLIIDSMREESNTFFNQLNEEDNIARLFYMIYEKSYCQDDVLGIQLLKHSFDENFFKESETRVNDNKILFYNKDFSISFSKTPVKQIEITDLQSKLPKPYLDISGYLELAKGISGYIHNKSLSGLKKVIELSDSESGIKSGFISPLRYYKASRVYNEDKLNEMLEIINEERDYRDRCESDYADRQDIAKSFIESLSSLSVFEKAGWDIELVNIDLRRRREYMERFA